MTAILAFLAAHWGWLAAIGAPLAGAGAWIGLGGGGLAGVAAALAWLDRHRSYLTLIVVALAAAGLWAWGAIGRADRARMMAWGNVVCASAGAELSPRKSARGEACASRIATLAREERESAAQSARILAKAASDRETKAALDSERARAIAADARAAAEAMEKANGSVEGDRVGPDWFRALNRVGGLRSPAG